MKKYFGLPLAAATTYFGYNYFSNPAYTSFWGSKETENTMTDSYIWGNGVFQARPDVASQFKNFEPKLIQNFSGPKSLQMQNFSFGEYHEAGVGVDGKAYIWKKHILDSSMPKNDNERAEIQELDSSKDNAYIKFSRGFAFILKKNGDVYQYKITPKLENNDQENIEVEVSKQPIKIKELKGIKQIDCGQDHFVALDKDGKVWSMGDDTLGQCGIAGDGRNQSPPFYQKRIRTPTQIPNLSGVKKISCGGNHSLALTEDGVVFGWGSNQTLQLSHEEEFAKQANPLIASFQPIRVEKNIGALLITDIACGNDHSIFIGRNRFNQETECYGCGLNIYGQVGGGNLSHISEVQKIEQLSNYTNSKNEHIRVSQVSCGANHCVALLSVGALLEWGANEHGQLGNKKRVFTENPVIIKKFSDKNVLGVYCGMDNTAVITESTLGNNNNNNSM